MIIISVNAGSTIRVQQEIRNLKEGFKKLVTATRSAIEKKRYSVNELLDQIIYLPVDFEARDVKYLSENADNLRESKSVPAVLDRLSFHWDYLHPDIYRELIFDFQLSSVTSILAVYQKELEVFLDQTLLKVFCEVERMRRQYINPPQGFTQLLTGHCWIPPVYLSQLERFRQEFASYLCLKQAAVIVVGILKGSVITTMLVPEVIELKIKSLDPEFIKEHSIVHMEFKGSVVYSEVSIIGVSLGEHHSVTYFTFRSEFSILKNIPESVKGLPNVCCITHLRV